MLLIESLRKSFGSRVAVDSVSLEIRSAEIFGLLGPNGAGKSTTVNICSGLMRPDSGRVTLFGGTPAESDIRRRIGLAPQSLSLYEELTAEENIDFFAQLQGLRGTALRDRVAWALRFVELYERRRDLVRTFSGGMKRRLNLAIALVHDPRLLILDEPTAGVDPQSRNAIFDKILELRAAGCTIIYTTHYMEEAERLCDRIAILDHGRVLAIGTLGELLEQYAPDSTIILEDGGAAQRIETQDPIGELIRLREDGRLTRFRVERPTLETVFLHLTGRRLRDT